MKKYYIYYHCDEWKSTSSMNTIGIFDEAKLKEVITEDLKNDDIEIDSGTNIPDASISDLNIALVYAHIEPIVLNERI